jgi:hypothetical protein
MSAFWNIVTFLAGAIIMRVFDFLMSTRKEKKIKLDDLDKRVFALESQRSGRDSMSDTLTDLKTDLIVVKKILDKRRENIPVENDRRQNETTS